MLPSLDAETLKLMFKSYLLGWRGVILATFCVVVIAVSAYLAAHPERTFLLPRVVPHFLRDTDLSPQSINILNPLRDRTPERASREILEAAKRGDCNGKVWSTVYLLPDQEADARYTVSRKAEFCRDFASVQSMKVVDFVYWPHRAHLLFECDSIKAPLVAVVLERDSSSPQQWRIIEFMVGEQAFSIR